MRLLSYQPHAPAGGANAHDRLSGGLAPSGEVPNRHQAPSGPAPCRPRRRAARQKNGTAFNRGKETAPGTHVP